MGSSPISATIILIPDRLGKSGILGFTSEFSEKFGYRKPNYFTVKDLDFKVSHLKSIIVIE